MKTRVAINGFGRIGRNAFKVAFDRSDIEIVAINDLTETRVLAHLLKHDSNYGTYRKPVSFDENRLIVDGQYIRVYAEKDPANLPWKDLDVDVVIESTGFFVDPAKARAHIDAGAKRVVISAPAKGEGATTIVLGVNDDKLTEASEIISNASCTTNCITPVASVIESRFGIEKAMMTTVHSYTASQALQDGPSKDLREARNAAENIVPTTTGASIAAGQALPSLQGVFGGLSVRVPTPVVSLADFVIITKRPVTVDEVNQAFKEASVSPMLQGVLDVTEEELVSSDFIGNSHSAIVDLKLTAVVDGNMLKVVAWYDNEWGYSNRLVENVADVGHYLHVMNDGEKIQQTEVTESATKEPQLEAATMPIVEEQFAAQPVMQAQGEIEHSSVVSSPDPHSNQAEIQTLNSELATSLENMIPVQDTDQAPVSTEMPTVAVEPIHFTEETSEKTDLSVAQDAVSPSRVSVPVSFADNEESEPAIPVPTPLHIDEEPEFIETPVEPLHVETTPFNMSIPVAGPTSTPSEPMTTPSFPSQSEMLNNTVEMESNPQVEQSTVSAVPPLSQNVSEMTSTNPVSAPIVSSQDNMHEHLS